jgi:hypothetical protein
VKNQKIANEYFLERGLGVTSNRSDKFVFKKKDLVGGALRVVELEALK